MKLLLFFGLLLIFEQTKSNPIIKRDAEDLDPLNEIYVMESEGNGRTDDVHGDREKRKIGVIKLGVSNGILNFVFGKLDSFLDAKTKALAVLDESNKAKNAIYGIDNKQSATSAFISDIIGKKFQAGTSSIGPLINSATTFISTKGQGLLGTLTSKLAPLSSLSGGLSGGNAGDGSSSGGSGFGSILNLITSLSGSSSSGLAGGSNGNDDNKISTAAPTTRESIPEFSRDKVALDIPPEALGKSASLVIKASKIVGNLVQNSAKRTERLAEAFKPLFRGAFAIKGLPSDSLIKRSQRTPTLNSF